ncbi:MAG TPA: hypothetical protein DD429_00115 [Clostridiaceae bacterium]|nr:hypothetical protein [Clostridiaceae bacterium]
MNDSRKMSCFPMGLFKDADEPIICDSYIILVQNLSKGSKIIIYDMAQKELKPVFLKDVSCFNVSCDNRNIVFEFSGLKRGVGILNVNSLKLDYLDDLGNDIMLGGIWKNYIAFRRRSDVVLFDIKHKRERVISSCRHIIGSPVLGYGNCAWLQQYKDKSCVGFYDIENRNSLFLSSSGYINRIYLLEKKLVYQNCSDNKCSIYTYDIKTGFITKVFESYDWIELYKGRDGSVVWTTRRLCGNEYIFDIWIYNVNGGLPDKIISERCNAVIPAASGNLVLWLDAKSDGDSVSLIDIDM